MYEEFMKAIVAGSGLALAAAPTAHRVLPLNFRFSDTTKSDQELIEIAKLYGHRPEVDTPLFPKYGKSRASKYAVLQLEQRPTFTSERPLSRRAKRRLKGKS